MSQQPHEPFSRHESGYRIRALRFGSAFSRSTASDGKSLAPADHILPIELILSLLGIFGIGWLL